MKTEVPDLPSLYYPPRARYSSTVDRGRRSLAWLGFDFDSPELASELPRLLADIVVPGRAFAGRGWRRVPLLLGAGWALGLALSIVLLGTGVGNSGFALAISLHAVSAGQGFAKHLQRRVMGLRMALGLTLGAGLALGVYLPAVTWFCAHVALPLRTPRGVVIVNPRVPPTDVRRGDWVAYHFDRSGLRGNIVLHEGLALGRVLAVAGDRVEFGAAELVVNDQRLPRRDWMPQNGDLTVACGSWFIWPELTVGRNTLGEEALNRSFLSLSSVSSAEFAGRAFNRWFFRSPKP